MPTRDDIKEIRDAYELADQFAREVGEFREKASIPAHNELRYAGHHLLQSINENGTVVDDELLQKAKSHCRRAMYEAAESGIVSALKGISNFHKDHRSENVSAVISNYAEILLEAKNAQKKLARGRSERQSVEQHVGEYMEIFRGLRDKLDLLEVSRSELSALRRKDVVAFRRYALLALLSLIGVLLAAWRVLLQLQ